MNPLGWFLMFAAVITAGSIGFLAAAVLSAWRVHEAQHAADTAEQRLDAYRAQVENPPAPFEYDTRCN